MKKYLVLYHAPAAALEKMNDATPEQMKAGMEPWIAWAERCGDGLVDMGTPLGGGRKVTASGSSASDKDVVGYSILQAENAEAHTHCCRGIRTWSGRKAARSKCTSRSRCRHSSSRP